MYGLYKTLTSLGEPLVESHIKKRVAEKKEDPLRLDERYGLTNIERPSGNLIWFHAASVGESMSILVLIKKLLSLNESFSVLVTSTTQSSAMLLADKLPQKCIHQYLPYDVPKWVNRFLTHWQPDLAIWVESELWPNLVYETAKRSIPQVLLNGTMSDKSVRNWNYIQSAAAHLFACFDEIISRSPEDKLKLQSLGAKDVKCHGNLKFASLPLSINESDLSSLTTQIGDRPFYLAASTHPGEEESLIETHQALKAIYPDFLTLISPRHSTRGGDIRLALESEGLSVAQRSLTEPILETTDIYLCDTMGEMGTLYALSNIVFMGGSLVPIGGHNIIEPAQLNCALIQGPHTFKQNELVESFTENDYLECITTPAELATTIQKLIDTPSLLSSKQSLGKELATSKAQVIESVLYELIPYLRKILENETQRTSLLV